MHASDTPKNEILQIALQSAERGWLVFPCDNANKRPLTDNGLHAATRDAETITRWFTRWPGAMVGIRTGPESGVFVVDADNDADKQVDGVAALKQLFPDLPDTITVKTPRGGRHYYFAYPDDGTEIRNSAGKLAPGVDVRGTGGYVIAAGSTRSDGISYQILAAVYPGPPPAPRRLLDLLTADNDKLGVEPELANFAKAAAGQRTTNSSNGNYGSSAVDGECGKVASAAPGTRNHTLNSAAFNLGQLVAGGVLPGGEVKSRLFDAASASGLVKDDGAEATQATINSGFTAGLKQPRTPPEKPAPSSSSAAPQPQTPAFSDDAIALRFADEYVGKARYVAAWSKWLRYDGCRWRTDETTSVFDVARITCRAVALEANKPAMRRALASAKTVAAVERLARSDRRLAATTEQWDADLWSLNTPSGVVDLRTGKLRPHRAEDYMTKMTAVAPAGDCPLWRVFLKRITGGDCELQQFLQRWCGYALTGSTSEHALGFGFGVGANGKSVFTSTVAGILADYATTAPIETFTVTQSEQHPTELARLRGARLVVATETEEGRRWAESKIKMLTGGDRTAARFMRQDFFEFTPQFKLWIIGNHKPGLRSVNEAIRRRFLLVPFEIVIPEAERDKDLAEKLRAEWPGILQWMIDGTLEWQRTGLAPPGAVINATSAYLEAEDAISLWLDECTIPDKNAWESGAALFASWKGWCELAGEFVGTRRRFLQNLETKPSAGIMEERRKYARGYSGRRITAPHWETG